MPENTRIKVRFADIDAMGHVNNSYYLTYFEEARIDFFRQLIGSHWNWSTNGVILGSVEIKYINPVHQSDDIYVETRCVHIGNKSLTFEYLLFAGSGADKVLKSWSKSVLVCFNYTDQKTISVPEQWRSALKIQNNFDF